MHTSRRKELTVAKSRLQFETLSKYSSQLVVCLSSSLC